MIYKLRFLLIYFVIIAAIFSFFLTSNKQYSKQLNITNEEISGVSYIQLIYHLGIDLIDLKNFQTIKIDNEHIQVFKKNISTDIKSIYKIQEDFREYQSTEFNDKLSKIELSLDDDNFYYELIDALNQENYRIGDISKILFEQNREIYFLGTLITHYMPEYLISLLLNTSYIEEFYYNGELSTNKKNLFLEQNKLVHLSLQEISEIIFSLKPTPQTLILKEKMIVILDYIKKISKNKELFTKWNLSKQQSQMILFKSKKLVELSKELNTYHIELLSNLLNNRKSTLENQILENKITLLAILILITLVSLYFYKIQISSNKKEQELKKTHKQLDKIVLYSKTDIDGNIMHMSSALLKLSGYTMKDVIGKSHRIFKHIDNPKDIYKDLWKTITSKKVWQGEIKNLANDGTVYWIRLTITPELGSIGNIIAYNSHSIDITNLKNLEVEKLKTQKALEFRSSFLSNMSHEIRTPLNSIIGFTGIAVKNESSKKQLAVLQNITTSSKILLGIINDILDISKIEAGKMQLESIDFNIKALMQTVQSIMNVKALEKGLALNINYYNFENYDFLGDTLRISQILNNLIGNAIKFTSKGQIDVLVTKKENNIIRFDVKDSGIGLKQQDIKLLFEEFTQADMSTSRKFGGTGLGLSISKHLVNMMDGQIWVESIFGDGATFSFELPLKEGLPSDTNNNVLQRNIYDLETKVNSLNSSNILVAEDNKMNQTLLNILLEDSNIKIDFASDGEIAINRFKNNSYSLVLMDIQMPNMNGYDAAKEIRSIDQQIPIIALSANVMQEDVSKAYASGMNDYLVKPIENEKLYEVLLKYIK